MNKRPRNALPLSSAQGISPQLILLLLLLGLSLLLVFTLSLMLAQANTNMVGTSGRVLSCSYEEPSSSKCRPTVSFRTESGQQITFVSSNPHDWLRPGDTIPVRYDPTAPQQASEDPFPTEEPFVAVVAGLILLLVLGMLCQNQRTKRAINQWWQSKKLRWSQPNVKKAPMYKREGFRRRTVSSHAIRTRVSALNKQKQKSQ